MPTVDLTGKSALVTGSSRDWIAITPCIWLKQEPM